MGGGIGEDRNDSLIEQIASWILQYGLAAVMELFSRKFGDAKYSRVHVLKSLTYFEDAEKDPMPDMLVPVSWASVRAYFATEVPRLL